MFQTKQKTLNDDCPKCLLGCERIEIPDFQLVIYRRPARLSTKSIVATPKSPTLFRDLSEAVEAMLVELVPIVISELVVILMRWLAS